MAEYNPPPNPPRDHANEPGARNETHIHSTTPPAEKRSSTAMAFIVGGVAVGLIILYFLFGGFGGNGTAPTTGGPTDNSTNITVDPGTGTTDTAPASDPVAPPPAAEPESAPAPEQAAPEPAPAD